VHPPLEILIGFTYVFNKIISFLLLYIKCYNRTNEEEKGIQQRNVKNLTRYPKVYLRKGEFYR